MPYEEDRSIARFEVVLNDPWRVCRLEATCDGEGRPGVARTPEQLSRLPRPKLAAVPDDVGLYAPRRHCDGQLPGRRATWFGQRLHGIDRPLERQTMVGQHDHAAKVARSTHRWVEIQNTGDLYLIV